MNVEPGRPSASPPTNLPGFRPVGGAEAAAFSRVVGVLPAGGIKAGGFAGHILRGGTFLVHIGGTLFMVIDTTSK